MPGLIDVYFQSLLDQLASISSASSFNMVLDRRTSQTGLIRGDLYFLDGSRLHFRELLEMQESPIRLMYTFHYQKADGTLIFRYDDTPHHKHLVGFPHHKHAGHEKIIIPAEPPSLEWVLWEVEENYHPGQK